MRGSTSGRQSLWKFTKLKLDEGDHIVTLTANISDPTQILGFDRAIVESGLTNGYVVSVCYEEDHHT